jgi:hypothetical protein
VVQPVCHGRGFIPFCLEKPALRVERFVSLWQNAFPVLYSTLYLNAPALDIATPDDMDIAAPDGLKNNKLSARDITRSVGEWFVEALLLPSLGMPKESFTLILDGNPTPEATTAAFCIVQRDVAWQVALDIVYQRGLLPQLSWLERRLETGYTYECLPTAVNNISMASPLVRCNFDLGEAHDAEALVKVHSG